MSIDRADAKATRIALFSLRSPQMRAFHMSWFAFFMCFFAWFGIAPLMKVVRDELHLTKAQIGNTIIASVAVTVLARLVVGWLCDRIGPRITYTWLLVLGSLPVMGIGLAHSYGTFLAFRLAIGVIGAAFVITQFHTTSMFAPNVIGTANATTAGWGNLGGGVTQLVMPLLFAALLGLGMGHAGAWRASMVVAGVVCMLLGVAYYRFTQDTPEGNFAELRAAGRMPARPRKEGSFRAACSDGRVWALFMLYGACFGVELTLDNVAALYFADDFAVGLETAGLIASLFGLMNLFARTLGGIFGDKFARRFGLQGRVVWLFAALFVEGLLLTAFSRMTVLPLAIAALVASSLFVQMSCGATYSVVPFVNPEAVGSVSGIVGAGGNAAAVLAGFLFKGALPWSTALLILGVAVTCASFAALGVRLAPAEERSTEAVAAVEAPAADTAW